MIAFFWHYGLHLPFAAPDQKPMYRIFFMLYEHGQLAVELFFILSGFGLMIGYREKILRHEISFPEFFKRRLSKLYPLIFISLLIMTVLQFFHKLCFGEIYNYVGFDIQHFVMNLFCIQYGILGNDLSFNGPAWCITQFFFCYIIYYYNVYRSKSKNEVYYRFLAIWLVGAAIMGSGFNYPTLLNYGTGRTVCSFATGVLLYGIYEKRMLFNSRLLGYLSLFAVIWVPLIYCTRGMEAVGNLQWTVILVFWPAVILAALFVPWLNRALQWRPLVYLGKKSMIVYLLHVPVECVMRIADKGLRLGFNYSLKRVWLLYVFLVVFTVMIYDQDIDQRYRRFMKKIWLKALE